MNYSEEELAVIRTVFDSCDFDNTGRIHINQLSGMLMKLGKTDDEIVKITEMSSKFAEENEGLLQYEDVLHVLQQTAKSYELPFEGSDPKVLEFLQILEEYRVKCEEEGNYLEAARAYRQLGVLRKQEEKRQQKAIQARQISEKQDVQLAHNMQFNEFNKAWDKYLEEYDSMAQTYIQQMTERHSVVLLEFQKQLRADIASKPPKWSKELLDQRRKQHINARNKNYTQAQKLKRQSDKTEEKERREMEQAQAVIFARREAKFRMQQQTELQALLKRIECRRKEHIKQRNLDTKRLLQRNKNVQAVLDGKQAQECQKLFAEIKKTLYSSAALHGGGPAVKLSPQQEQYQQQQYQQQEAAAAPEQSSPPGPAGGGDGALQAQLLAQQEAEQAEYERKFRQYEEQQQQEAAAQEAAEAKLQAQMKALDDKELDPLEKAIDNAIPIQSTSGAANAASPSAGDKSASAGGGFMQEDGPNFTNLVYGGESFEDESVEDAGVVY
eukprot:CAMPEP_0175024542 /NCGR_PEP_ID=MMETSP0005-20121125/16524_1 /TAXON_ID=420556 /ORGANISM="Ochromonas sp., Strain CCMP1393" /LENGTH=496 /DNA_ID=CAMNT_0016283105 /DNA_START=26 /DNA_END=1517 /DNA_ORIENTATION=-